jgi:CRP-like cAMP-binding protein
VRGAPGLDWLPAGVWRGATLRELAAGETLFHQGDPAAAIFGVEAGRLRLLRVTADDRRIALHTARPGELFAEAALFAAAYHCDAVAATAARVRCLPKAKLLAAFRADPDFAEHFMAILARQVMTLRARLELRSVRSARRRLVEHILLAGDGGRRLRLDGTLADLAEEVGLTPEALYRTLAALEQAGIVARTAEALTLLKSSGA